MNIELRNKNGKLIYNNGLIVFENGRTGNTISLSGGNEFVLYSENENGVICALDEKAFVNKGISTENENEFCLSYERDKLRIKVRYTAKETVFVKRLEIFAGEEIFVKRVCLENRTVAGKLSRGGEGQPVFVKGENVALWCGIEFPAANNRYEGTTLAFTQAPFEKTKEFFSLPVVYGLDDCGDLLGAFCAYIKGKALPKDSMRIYGDWGLHDDLTPGDPVLTAEMTLKNIRDIADFSKKTGVKFDYYLMDAYWFERYTEKPYTEFCAETFPEGYRPVVDALKEAGIRYGLWFDINCIHGKPVGLEKYDTALGNGSVCLACDEVARLVTDAIAKQIEDCGLKMLKLDFAYFECKNPEHGHSVDITESKEKSIKNFIRMVGELKKSEPDLKILCYNGWTTSLDWLGSVQKREGYAISPYWCEYVDYLYCGDPRPSEIVSEKAENSIVWYTDAIIREFVDSAMPFDCIDDHGTMCGKTSTIYRLGKKPFRQGVLMNVMRGGKKQLVYGDISELDEEDGRYLAAVDGIYDRGMKMDYRTSLIGGDARLGEVYGYRLDGATEGYVVLVNPTAKEACYALELPQWRNLRVKAEIRIEDGLLKNAETEICGVLPVRISAGGYVLLEWRVEDSEKGFDKINLLPGEKLMLSVSGKKQLSVTFTKDGKPLRTGRGTPSGFKAYADGKELLQNVTTDIWSGVSWAYYPLNGAKEVVLVYEGKDVVTLKYYTAEEK